MACSIFFLLLGHVFAGLLDPRPDISFLPPKPTCPSGFWLIPPFIQPALCAYLKDLLLTRIGLDPFRNLIVNLNLGMNCSVSGQSVPDDWPCSVDCWCRILYLSRSNTLLSQFDQFGGIYINASTSPVPAILPNDFFQTLTSRYTSSITTLYMAHFPPTDLV